jgi:hypothetical protein
MGKLLAPFPGLCQLVVCQHEHLAGKCTTASVGNPYAAVGRVVISCHDRVSEDDQSYAGAAAVEGAFEAIAQLVQQRFREHVWLVSRCEESREPVLVAWLEQHGFFGSTYHAKNSLYNAV